MSSSPTGADVPSTDVISEVEIELFWRRKKSGATVLFLLARYLTLLSYVILGGATFARVSDESCALLQKVQYPTQILLYFVWAAFSGLRTLALSEFNWLLAAAVFILASGPFAVNAYSASGVNGANIPFVGCAGGSNATLTEAIILTSVSRACAITGEILIILVTLRYTLRGKGLRAPPGVVSSLAYVLTVNGTIYFLIVVILSTLQLALTLVSDVYALDLTSDIVVFADPLTAVLICRFLLDLQHTNQRALDPAFDDTHGEARGDHTMSLRFASRVIGSIGGSLPAAGHDMDAFDLDTGVEFVSEVTRGPGE